MKSTTVSVSMSPLGYCCTCMCAPSRDHTHIECVGYVEHACMSYTVFITKLAVRFTLHIYLPEKQYLFDRAPLLLQT